MSVEPDPLPETSNRTPSDGKVWDQYWSVWRKATQFTGRADRREYWTFALINAGLFVIPPFILGLISETLSSVVMIPISLFLLAAIVPSIAVAVRRLHDRNLSGWVLLIALIPVLGSLALLVVFLLPGTPEENRFGRPGNDLSNRQSSGDVSLFGGQRNAHELPPQRDNGIDPVEEAAAADRILQGDYYAELMALRDFVSGKTVVRSVAGNVGFILFLDDATWVAAYRRGERVEHAMGSHAPGIELMSAIVSQEYGDASKPLAANVIYANETCDNAEEVAKSHGSKITTLSIGERSFNFAFADDHELDVKLVDDRDGRPAFRVFWEQW